MPYTFGYGQQKTTTTEDIRNIPGRLNRGFTQESPSFITPSIKNGPTFTQKVLSTVPKPVLKAFSSDSILLRNPLTAPIVIPAQKLFPNTFGKESERLRKRFVDSASFGLTGEIDKYLGKDVSYREGKSFANDKLGATLDLTATLGGYLVPGLGWAKAAKAIGVGAKAIPKLAQGATKLQQVNRLGKITAQQAKEGVAVGAAISGSEIGVREAINPDDYSASDNLRKLGVDTLSGLVLDPAFYAGGKLIGKGYSKLFKKIENQPEVKQNVQNVVNLKNIPQVQQDIKIAAMSTDGKNYLLRKINPNFELPKKVSKLPTTKLTPSVEVTTPKQRTEAEIKTEKNMQENKRFSSNYENVSIDDALKLIEFDRTLPKYDNKIQGRQNIEKLKKDILENGLEEPIIIQHNPNTGFTVITEGNHRIQALKELGFKEVPVFTEINTNLEKIKGRLGAYLPLKILPDEFGEYKFHLKLSDILQKNDKILVRKFNPETNKMGLSELLPNEELSDFQIKQLNKIKKQQKNRPVKESRQRAIKKELVKEKKFKITPALKEMKKLRKISNKFLFKKQKPGDSTIRYPINPIDVNNPERYKGRWGQAPTLIPRDNNYNTSEFFTEKEIVRLSDIIRKAKQAFNLKYSTKNAVKSVIKQSFAYYRGTGQIKARAYDDIQTFFHELAHFLENSKYNFYEKLKQYPKSFQDELLKESDKYITNAGWGLVYQRGTQQYFEEGLSEFFRRYMFYPEFEPGDSPAYFKLINDFLDKNDKKIIKSLQEDVAKFTEQNLYERLLSEVSFEEGKPPKFRSYQTVKDSTDNFMEKVYSQFVDEQRPIQKALEPFGEQGDKLFREFRLMKGVGGLAKQWIENGVTNSKGKIIFKSLNEIMKPVKDNYQQFVLYVINKRADDLIKRGFDVGNKATDTERELFVKSIEQKFPEFVQAQKDLVKFQRYALALLVKAEKISKKEFQQMKQLNPNYVPFYRDFDLDELSPQQAKFYGLVPGLFTMKGSTREIIDPIEGVIKNLYSFAYIAEKNKTLKSFVDTLLGTRDLTVLAKSANYLEKLEIPTKGTNFTLKEIRGLISEQFLDERISITNELLINKKVIEKFLQDGKITQETYDKEIAKIEEEARIKIREIKKISSEFDYEQLGTIFRPNPAAVKNKGNVIAISRNKGNKIITEYYQLSPDIYNAIANSDTRDLGFIFNAMNIPTRIFRTGITSTFEFLFKNLFRDQFSYAINSKAGYVPYVDLIRGMFHVMGKSKEYQQFLTSGAEQSFRSSLDRNYLKEDIRKIVKQKSKIPGMNILKNPEEILLAVEKMSQFLEASSKVGNFAKGLRKFETPGKSTQDIIKEAAMDSRDLIDFSRRGSIGKKINAVSAFFNSAVQGLDKTVRVFKDPKTRYKALSKSILYITVPTITLYMANRDNPKYQELQDWDKDLFWHFWVGDTHYRLPIPFELGVVFKVIPERIMATLDQQDKAWSGFGKTIMNTFNFIPSNPSNGFGITLLSPVIQAVGNTNYFGGKIVPTREQFLAPEDKFGYNTSESAKLIGKIVSKIPGYRDVKMLEILATPRYVDNIVQGYFGTLGQYGLSILDVLINPVNTLNKPSKEIGSLPGFKAFIAPQITNTKSFDEFYNELNRLREEYNKSLKNNTQFLEKGKKSVFEKAAKVLQEFSSIERQIQNDKNLSSSDKRDKLIKLHQAEVNFIRQFLGKPLLTQYVPNKNN